MSSPSLASHADDFAGIYRYTDIDRTFIGERVAQFRAQVARRLEGSLSEEEFKPLRLKNGFYLQLHAYMLRVAIPYGILSARQLRQLAYIAQRFDRGYGHFTTRQNLQYNWIKLEEAPDILAALAEVDMHALQTSGNCVRNITLDHFVGIAPDEVLDARVYAEILRQWTTLHPEFSYLPRKFKIAITGAEEDRAAVSVHDIGLIGTRDATGAVGFRVLVGGGMGRAPFLGKVARDFLPEADLLGYVEAIMRVYNAYGRRDNMHKARIKILLHELGLTEFLRRVEAEFASLPKAQFSLAPELVAQIQARFANIPYESLPEHSSTLARWRAQDPAFDHWVRVNTHPHRQPGYTALTLSLKPVGAIPGDASAEQMAAVATLAERYSFGEIRVTHEQNLVLAHVRQDDLHALWQELVPLGLATPNSGLISDIIACPGLDYCSLANARSIPIAQRIATTFANLEQQYAIGPLKVKISGCINACGHHHVGHIGILGVDKKGEEFYQILIGGDAGSAAALGAILGQGFSSDDVVGAVERLVGVYLATRQPGEHFIDTYKRIGITPFRAGVYGETTHAAA
jgi:sulfite reductase (NADPH) hemoprotein beta-component